MVKELILKNIAEQDPVLELGGLGLVELSADIGLATHVTRLSLRGNALESLPAEIGLLVNLTFLSAADNQLSQLPAEIGHLTNLTRLNLKNNQLSELPLELLELDQLALLRLDGNQLELPDDILRKWDRPAEIVAYYRKYCLPEPEPIVLSIDRKIAIYFDDHTLRRLADMLCVPAEELDGADHEARATQLLAYHTQHGLRDELTELLNIYRPDIFIF